MINNSEGKVSSFCVQNNIAYTNFMNIHWFSYEILHLFPNSIKLYSSLWENQKNLRIWKIKCPTIIPPTVSEQFAHVFYVVRYYGTNVLWVMPCSTQQALMSGSLGAFAVLRGLASPGVRVKDRIALDGWLEPWMFLAVTVTSYIVNGTRLPTTALFVPLET